MKPTKIKAWPELTGFQPGLVEIRVNPVSNTAQIPIEIDFGSVRQVTSTGLTIFLLRVFGFLKASSPVQIVQDCEAQIRNKLEALGAFSLLQTLNGSTQAGLVFEAEKASSKPRIDDHICSVPVFHLAFSKTNPRREEFHRFKRWLLENLSCLLEEYDSKPNALIQLMGEIAKNTADHADTDGLFGMDLMQLDERRSLLTFAFGDLGEGIKRNVEKHMSGFLSNRLPHLSLYEPYRLALTPGFSSKGEKGQNKGHGMTIIIDCAKDLGAHLSIFDANSRGLLTDLERIHKPSHAAVRRIFHNVGNNVGFFYYGELHLTKKGS